MNAFAHTTAHDIKSPVSVIAGLGELILDHCQQGGHGEITELAQRLVQVAYKVGHIVDNLLMLAQLRRQEIDLQPLNMAAILDEAEARLADMIEARGARLERPEEWPLACGYAPWIEEVWVNYVSNALKYGGNPPLVRMGATPEGQQVRFWVQDNGIGFGPEAQAQLFTAFTRVGSVSSAGHGLGLSIARRIIERLGGTVRAESAGLNQGSVFSFTLPIARQ